MGSAGQSYRAYLVQGACALPRFASCRPVFPYSVALSAFLV
jgi:hypothetical protein